MPRVVFLKKDADHHRVALGVDDGSGGVLSLSVKDSTYISLGEPAVGDVLDGSTLDELMREDEILRCLRRLTDMLSHSDKSRYELKVKLFKLGFSRAAVDSALEICEEYGYLDEARQLERLIEREANRSLKGKYYIWRKLAAKGYGRGEIERVTALLVERGEIDFDANFRRLCEKLGVADEDETATLKYRYGYRI